MLNLNFIQENNLIKSFKRIDLLKLDRFTINNFIPAIWSAQLLVTLKQALVYGQANVINRDYEGEITAYGDTVKINGIGPVTVGDYTKNTNLADPETLTDDSRSLLISQSKSYNFQIDDIDSAQQNPQVMQQAMTEAAYAIARVADQYIAGLYTEVAGTNLIGTVGAPIVFTAVTDAYESLVRLGVLLDENNVPEMGRFVVVPPWYHGLLLKDDRFVKAADAASTAARLNGQVGEAAGFTILKSNNVPYLTITTEFKILAGYNGAWSYAEQINDTEAYRPEKRFADAVKGLHLYGAKVTRPTALAVLNVNRPSL
jgi:N4-gp56 family major capsid protein